MSASNKRPLHIRHWIALLSLAAVAVWYCAPPKVYSFYSKDGAKAISYALNTQHTIARGDLNPSGTTGDIGLLFPDEEFFMEFHWWRDNERRHCISITPKWPTTQIHLDRNGDIDISESGDTDTDRLKQCAMDTAKPWGDIFQSLPTLSTALTKEALSPVKEQASPDACGIGAIYMSATTRMRCVRWMILLLVTLTLAFWYFASPVVSINFSPNSKEEFRYVWVTQDRIHRGDISHGGSAIEFSYIFPDEDFFMLFDWWTDKGFTRCIDITPKWGRTIDIYLDNIGRIDTAKTGAEVIARLKKCPGQSDPFRS